MTGINLFPLFCRKNLEGHVSGREASIHAGGRAAEGPAHYWLSQLQVQAPQEEAAEEEHQASGGRCPLRSELALHLWLHGVQQPHPPAAEPAGILPQHAHLLQLPGSFCPITRQLRKHACAWGRGSRSSRTFPEPSRDVPTPQSCHICHRTVSTETSEPHAVCFLQPRSSTCGSRGVPVLWEPAVSAWPLAGVLPGTGSAGHAVWPGPQRVWTVPGPGPSQQARVCGPQQLPATEQPQRGPLTLLTRRTCVFI